MREVSPKIVMPIELKDGTKINRRLYSYKDRIVFLYKNKWHSLGDAKIRYKGNKPIKVHELGEEISIEG